MSKKILKFTPLGLLGGSIFGGKKKVDPAAPVAGQPIVTPLSADETAKRKKLNRQPLGAAPIQNTILSDTLGG